MEASLPSIQAAPRVTTLLEHGQHARLRLDGGHQAHAGEARPEDPAHLPQAALDRIGGQPELLSDLAEGSAVLPDQRHPLSVEAAERRRS
jgi:hypothetical protein